MSKMILGGFGDRNDADRAIQELETKDYSTDDISVITQETKKVPAEMGDRVDSAEGAASGAATGGAIGGLAGLLAGAGVFPALAGLLIGGPIAAALGLTGVAATTISGAVTGALAGGLLGALTDLGVNEETARAYNTTVEEGGVIVAVAVPDDEVAVVQTVIEAHGASDVTTIDAKDNI